MTRELRRLDELKEGDYICCCMRNEAILITDVMGLSDGSVRYCGDSEHSGQCVSISLPPDQCKMVLSEDEPEVQALIAYMAKERGQCER
jgi:hypothetical protein